MEYSKIIDLVKQTKTIIFDENLRKEVELKGEADFVTEIDFRVSNFLKNELYKLYPTVGFMCEEETNNTQFDKKRWILDPIDGTTNLVYDFKISTVSLAYAENDKIIFGIVYNPYLDEIFTAYYKKGAYINGKQIKVVERELAYSLIEFGIGSNRKDEADFAFDVAKEIFKNCLDIRRLGSAALAICNVACGRVNGYFEKKLNPWDYAAASLILTESGGEISDWKGNSLQFENYSTVVGGTETVQEFLLDIIQKNIEK